MTATKMKMPALLGLVRFKDWWNYKIPSILAMAYLLPAYTGYGGTKVLCSIFLLLVYFVLGASFASVVNDLTDIRSDRLAGKSNMMARLSTSQRFGLLLAVTVLAALFCNRILPTGTAILLALTNYLAFVLYSVRPFRLKDRGIWGVLVVALGESMLPSVFSLYFMGVMLQVDVIGPLYLLVALCSWCYGIRAILWHQYQDKASDAYANTGTLVLALSDRSLKRVQYILFVLECISCLLLLCWLNLVAVYCFLALYLFFLYIRKFRYKHSLVYAISAKGSAHSILLFDFYQFFLPVALLLSVTFAGQYGYLLLLAHLVLFHRPLWVVGRDFWHYFRYLWG